MGVLYCYIYIYVYVFSSCLRAQRKIDSSIGLPSLNKVVTYLLKAHFSAFQRTLSMIAFDWPFGIHVEKPVRITCVLNAFSAQI